MKLKHLVVIGMVVLLPVIAMASTGDGGGQPDSAAEIILHLLGLCTC